MFDPGIANLIDGEDIDRPFNAMTLTHELHRRFGALEIYFESQGGYTYKVCSTKSYPWQDHPCFPLMRTLFLSSNRTIDPPSSRLLAVHRACALILQLSGAGEYIDKVLRDQADQHVRADGSTELGSILTLKLGTVEVR
jgi:hypothetical protein